MFALPFIETTSGKRTINHNFEIVERPPPPPSSLIVIFVSPLIDTRLQAYGRALYYPYLQNNCQSVTLLTLPNTPTPFSLFSL